MFVIGFERIMFSDGHYDIHPAEVIESPVTIQVSEEVDRRVIIDVFIVEPIKEIRERFDRNCEVVSSGEGHKFVE